MTHVNSLVDFLSRWLFVFLAVVLFVVLPGAYYAQAADASLIPRQALALAQATDPPLPGTTDYDLEGCQEDCKRLLVGRDNTLARLYIDCVQECNTKFWKAYDKRVQELKELTIK